MVLRKRFKNAILGACIFASAACFGQETVEVSGRKIDVADNGVITIKGDNDQSFKLSAAYFLEGWRKYAIEKSFDTTFKKDDGGSGCTITGKIPHLSGKELFVKYEMKLTWSETALDVATVVDIPENYKIMDKKLPYVLLEFPYAALRGSDVKLGAKNYKIPAHSKYAWGDQILVPKSSLKVKFDAKSSISAWSFKESGMTSVRANMTQTVKGQKRYESKFRVSFEKFD